MMFTHHLRQISPIERIMMPMATAIAVMMIRDTSVKEEWRAFNIAYKTAKEEDFKMERKVIRNTISRPTKPAA